MLMSVLIFQNKSVCFYAKVKQHELPLLWVPYWKYCILHSFDRDGLSLSTNFCIHSLVHRLSFTYAICFYMDFNAGVFLCSKPCWLPQIFIFCIWFCFDSQSAKKWFDWNQDYCKHFLMLTSCPADGHLNWLFNTNSNFTNSLQQGQW